MLTPQIVDDIQGRLAALDERSDERLVAGVWRPSDGLWVIALTGEMDMTNAAEFADVLANRTLSEPLKLIVDLSRLTFIDSIGIGALIAVAKAIRADGGGFALSGAGGAVERALAIVNIGRYLTLAGSLGAAVRSLGAPTDDTAGAARIGGVAPSDGSTIRSASSAAGRSGGPP